MATKVLLDAVEDQAVVPGQRRGLEVGRDGGWRGGAMGSFFSSVCLVENPPLEKPACSDLLVDAGTRLGEHTRNTANDRRLQLHNIAAQMS